MEATLCIGRNQQAIKSDDAHAGQARLTIIHITIGVLVIEHAADNVAAIKHRFFNDGDCRLCGGQQFTIKCGDQLRIVDELAS